MLTSPPMPPNPLRSFISPNSFLHIPPPPPPFPPSPSHFNKTIIFFVPGNPGLISYYHTFLSLLSASASALDPKTSTSSPHTPSSTSSRSCVIAGFSLGGFEVSSVSNTRTKEGEDEGGSEGVWEWEARLWSGSEKGPGGPLYGLREQIELTARRVGSLVEVLRELERGRAWKGERALEEEDASTRWKVILIGHSVGAYIALEVLRMHREQLSPGSGDDRLHWGTDFEITAAILLTPTIFDIAMSDNGRVVAPLLRYVPGLPYIVGLMARSITNFLLPEAWLEMLVRTVMGRDAPDEAVGTTVAFLRSRNGVRECLGMAKDEMREIGEDKWGEEVWGLVGDVKGERGRYENGQVKRLREPAELVLYFAKKDHWMADQTREAIISTRGGRGETVGPKMIIAEEGDLVHGWCIRQSGHVARQVAEWVEEIVMRK